MANWFGTLSEENIVNVCEMVEQLLTGRNITFTNNGRSGSGERLEPLSSTDPRSVWVARGIGEPNLFIKLTSVILPIEIGSTIRVQGTKVTIEFTQRCGIAIKWEISTT